MRRIFPLLFIALFSISIHTQSQSKIATAAPPSKSAPTIQQVIDKYLEAMGGKEKLQAIKSIVTENLISVGDTEIKMETKKMANKFRTTQTVMGFTVVQVFDGEKGYVEQMGKRSDLSESMISDLKKSIFIDALNYEAKNFTDVKVEKLGNKEYYALINDFETMYFDINTGLLYKRDLEDGSAIISSYLTVNDLKFPEVIEAEANGQKVTIKTTKVILNSGVSDEDFE